MIDANIPNDSESHEVYNDENERDNFVKEIFEIFEEMMWPESVAIVRKSLDKYLERRNTNLGV